MSPAQRIIGLGGPLLLACLLVGLFARGRYRSCYAFTAYVPAVLVPGLLISLWPERFYRADFWLLKESLHTVLKFAIALELAIRSFRAFPGAQATARTVVFGVVALTYIGVVAVPTRGGDYLTLANDLQPRIINGTIWLFTAISFVILWYRLPVSPLHKAILVGFVPYLLIFTVALSIVKSFGWELREVSSYLHTTAYLGLLVYWNMAVWRQTHEPAPLTRVSA